MVVLTLMEPCPLGSVSALSGTGWRKRSWMGLWFTIEMGLDLSCQLFHEFSGNAVPAYNKINRPTVKRIQKRNFITFKISYPAKVALKEFYLTLFSCRIFLRKIVRSVRGRFHIFPAATEGLIETHQIGDYGSFALCQFILEGQQRALSDRYIVKTLQADLVLLSDQQFGPPEYLLKFQRCCHLLSIGPALTGCFQR